MTKNKPRYASGHDVGIAVPNLLPQNCRCAETLALCDQQGAFTRSNASSLTACRDSSSASCPWSRIKDSRYLVLRVLLFQQSPALCLLRLIPRMFRFRSRVVPFAAWAQQRPLRRYAANSTLVDLVQYSHPLRPSRVSLLSVEVMPPPGDVFLRGARPCEAVPRRRPWGPLRPARPSPLPLLPP